MKSLKNKKILVVGDIHYPFNDPYVTEQLMEYLHKMGGYWDTLVHLGDHYDFHAISTHEKDPTLRVSVADEIAGGSALLAEIVNEGRFKESYFIAGNHEYRWDSYIKKNAPELLGLSGLDLEGRLSLPKGMRFIYSGQRESWLECKEVVFAHANIARSQSGATARACYAKFGKSVIQGHAHRAGLYYIRRPSGQIDIAAENPCMADLNPSYTLHPNWMQGLTNVEVDKYGQVSMTQTIIQKGMSF